MATYIILMFFWIANVDGQPIELHEADVAAMQERCEARAPGAFLTEWRAALRKYQFAWKETPAPQSVWPGRDYVCIKPMLSASEVP